MTAPSASRRVVPVWLIAETLTVSVVVALVFVKLASVSTGTWRSVFLANGDSLVLPLLLQSVQRGEPLHWVFSSQTFFFPEFPLYALCGLIVGTPQGGLVLNAFLNVVLLYVGFRAVAATFAPRKRLRQLLISLSGVVLFLIAALSEFDVKIVGSGTVEPSRIATGFLMTTYYGGAILVSLGMLAWLFWLSGRFGKVDVPIRRVVISGLAVSEVGAGITYSDPLYVLWFVAPFGLSILGLLIARRVTLRLALIVAFPQVLGIGLGMLGRVVFPQYVAANYDTYIAGNLAPSAAQVLLGVLVSWATSPDGIVRLLIVFAPIGLTLGFLLTWIRRRHHSDDSRHPSPAKLFLALFIIMSALTLILGEIVTGQSVTRYLFPLFVFPPLVLLLVSADGLEARLRGLSQRTRGAVAVALAATVLVAIGLTAPATADLADRRSPVDTACLDGWLNGRALNGVGSFWTVRALALYGHQEGRLVQVVPPSLGVHPWMNNLWLYEGRSFSYALMGGDVTAPELRTQFGTPAEIVSCSGFQIYDYSATAGAAQIDERIRVTLQTVSQQHRY